LYIEYSTEKCRLQDHFWIGGKSLNSINKNIGENLKKIRKVRNLTIDDLSASAKVSKSMISEIERGIRNPSITIIWNLANALKVPLNSFLKEERSDEPEVYRRKDTEQIGGDGYAFHAIMNLDTDKKFEIYFCEYEANTVTDKSTHFEGVEEYALVTQGTLTLFMNGKKYPVCEGEVLRFLANQEHFYANETDVPAKAYVLMFYPNDPSCPASRI
jgi:transcriptional regulator with XRE-family HTH domain